MDIAETATAFIAASERHAAAAAAGDTSAADAAMRELGTLAHYAGWLGVDDALSDELGRRGFSLAAVPAEARLVATLAAAIDADTAETSARYEAALAAWLDATLGAVPPPPASWWTARPAPRVFVPAAE